MKAVRTVRRVGRRAAAAAFCAAALGALVPAGAAAEGQGVLTAASSPIYMEGFQVIGVGNKFTAFGETLECSKGIGEATAEPGATTITAFATNSGGCNVGGLPATVFTNGCDALLHIGEAVDESHTSFTGNGDFICPEGKAAEVVIYSGVSHALILCKLTMGTQYGLSGPTVTNQEGGTLALEGSVTELLVLKSGLCGAGETNEGVLEGNAEVVAVDEGEEPLEISISTEEE